MTAEHDCREDRTGGETCSSCRCSLEGRSHLVLRQGDGAVDKCMRCGLRDWRALARATVLALLTGSLMTTLNHGPALLGGTFPRDEGYKLALSYLVPFLVAWQGALHNGFRARPS